MSDFMPQPWRLKVKNWRPNGLETWQMDRRTQDGRRYSWAIDSDQLYALADCVQDAIEEYESRTVKEERKTA